MKIHPITFTLLIVGGLNWGLEAAGYGIGSYIPEGVATTIYALVALSALYEIFSHRGLCRNCNPQGSQGGM